MTNEIQQALAALDHLQEAGDGPKCCVDARGTIARALQHAALEAECWMEIRAWHRSFEGLVLVEGESLILEAVNADADDRVEFRRDSWLEALTAAATFCRAELAK